MKVIKSLLILTVLCCSNIFAGTTGKISGRVIDKDTGEPMLGVNVVLVGTTLGAATDVNGEYYILNIPPGLYSVKASMIGFTTRILEKVRVQVDLTTKVDFEINPSSIEIGSEVTVIGKKEIQKDLTSSERSLQSDEIQELPVRDMNSLLSLQAGVTRDAGGNIHIRGGRTSEITYLVDGVQVLNPINRSAGISIDDQSIEELKAITGTFNAEYGQALSGVVNIVTKRGSDKFSINATAYSGDFLSFDDNVYYLMSNQEWATAAAKALASKSNYLDYDFRKNNISSYQDFTQKPWLTHESYLNKFDPFHHYDVQLNVSGPVPAMEKYVSYYVAGRHQYSTDHQYGRRYFMPWGVWSPASDTLNSFAMPDGALVPLGWYKGTSLQGKLFFNFDKLSLSYGIYYNKDDSYGGGQKYRPDGGTFWYTDRSTHILSLTYLFSNSTFLDIKGSYYLNTSKGYQYEDPYDYRYMPTSTSDFEQYIFRPKTTDDISLETNNNDFVFFGNDLGRGKNRNNYYSFNADLTSQINKNNLIKFGVSGRLHDLKQDYYTLQFSDATLRPLVPDTSSPFHSFYSAKPKEFAAYVQDKIEFEELIINIGVRFDYFYSDGRILSDVRDPQIYDPFKMSNIYSNYDSALPESLLVKRSINDRASYWYKKPDAKYQVSPRFGLSFPITADGVIHFSYGHFFQNPEFRFLYENPNFWVEGAGAQNLVGNANLNAERTVMYELGLQQKLFDALFLHVTGFYRDIRDWIGTGFPIDTYGTTTYYSYVNKDHATAKGITLSTALTLGNLSVNLDYTYMNANGTSSDVTDAYNDLAAGRAPRIQMINLDWDRTHSANLVLNYQQETWSATLIGTLNSGFPYTPEFARGESSGSGSFIGLRENSERRPTTFNIDLRFAKSFQIGKIKLQAMCDVTNLLDTRNANNVYADTGAPDFTLQDYLGYQRFIEISNTDEYFTNPGYYTAPRNISLGIRLSYN